MKTRRRVALEEEDPSKGSQNDETSESNPVEKKTESRGSKGGSSMKLRKKNPDSVENEKTSKKGSPNNENQHVSFEFSYPPRKVQMPVTKNEKLAAEISINGAKFLGNTWVESKNCLLVDETRSIKFASVGVFIERMRLAYNQSPTFLIIAESDQLSNWIDQVRYWTTQVTYVCTNSKSERQRIGSGSIYSDQLPIEDVGAVVISYDQFNKEKTVLPQIKWSSVIIDEPSNPMALSDLEYYHIVCILDKSVTDKQTINTLLGLNPKDKIESNCHKISVEDAAKYYLYEENLVLCPMVSSQQSSYISLLSTNKDDINKALNETKDIALLCGLAAQLRRASIHPHLIDSYKPASSPSNEDITLSSGKLLVLNKLLQQKRSESKKVVIFCNSIHTIPLINASLAYDKIPHINIDDEQQNKTPKEIIEEFNMSNSFLVLVVPESMSSLALDDIDTETIIAFDTDWTPIIYGPQIIAWHARQNNAQILRLITSDSIEQVMFEVFWRNRNFPPPILENLETTNPDLLIETIHITNKLAKDKLEQVRGVTRASIKEIRTLPYSDPNLFPPYNISLTEDTTNSETKPIDKPKVPKPITPAQFWGLEQFSEFISLFGNFGWKRISKYSSFGRPTSELNKMFVVITKHLLGIVENKEYPNIIMMIKDHGKFDQKRFISSISSFNQVIGQLNPNSFLDNLEHISGLEKMVNENVKEWSQVILNTIDVNPPSENWSEDDTKKLLYDAYYNGLGTISTDLIPFLFNVIKSTEKNNDSPPSAPPKKVMISLRAPKKIDANDHNRIIQTLMSYGYPDINSFRISANLLLHSVESVQKYVDNVLKYCTSGTEEKKSLLLQLAEKIVKYTSTKIPSRLSLFERIRTAAKAIDEYSAEDLEFLTALSSHGFIYFQVSPILTTNCFGSVSEIKLHAKVKSLFDEPRRNKVVQRLPEDVISKLPLKLNDMMMLLDMGSINPEHHNSTYIYPIGYKCAVVAGSLMHADQLVWYECSIELKNEKPLFVVHPLHSEGNRLEATTPDEVFSIFRTKLMKKAGIFIPPYDGHEMFGLTTAFVHKLLLEMPGIDQCENYQRRHFTTAFPIIQKWPVIGQFEKEPEKPVISVQTKQNISKFKYKKKVFGDISPPLVLDLTPLISDEKNRYVIDMRQEGCDIRKLINCCDKMMDFSEFLQTNSKQVH